MNITNIELFTEAQKKRIFIYLIVLVLSIGVSLRLYGIDLRVLFTDEAVHYSKILRLVRTNKYQPEEIMKYSYSNTLNDALNIYYFFDNSIKTNESVWKPAPYKFSDYIKFYSTGININTIVQPYYYIKHLLNNNAFRSVGFRCRCCQNRDQRTGRANHPACHHPPVADGGGGNAAGSISRVSAGFTGGSGSCRVV